MNNIKSLVNRFEPISLSEMSKVSLLKRTDTKYLLNINQLQNVLKHVHDHYRVLSINKKRLNHYQTLYFDTADFALYTQHHNGKLNRYKVRCRKYVDSNLCYLEVKFKTNKRKTIKTRMKIPDIITEFGDHTGNFLRDNFPFNIQSLEPKIRNNFLRITMVSKHHIERLTIDLNLKFQRDNNNIPLPGMVIAEVKQKTFSIESDFIKALRFMNLQPIGFSKYCIGTAMTYPYLKRNNFKRKFLLINKLNKIEVRNEYSI